jgi:hypothetical protein
MTGDQIEPLKTNETRLQGSYTYIDGQSVKDCVSVRILDLVKHHLKRVAIDDTGWLHLYRDPIDGRLWEFSYESYGHGLGPPSLQFVSREEAKTRYKLKD